MSQGVQGVFNYTLNKVSNLGVPCENNLLKSSGNTSNCENLNYSENNSTLSKSKKKRLRIKRAKIKSNESKTESSQEANKKLDACGRNPSEIDVNLTTSLAEHKTKVNEHLSSITNKTNLERVSNSLSENKVKDIIIGNKGKIEKQFYSSVENKQNLTCDTHSCENSVSVSSNKSLLKGTFNDNNCINEDCLAGMESIKKSKLNKTVEGKLKTDKEDNKKSIDSSSSNNSSMEKSRNDVMAERQAKKLAKQNAKKKDKSASNTSVNSSGEGVNLQQKNSHIDNTVVNKADSINVKIESGNDSPIGDIKSTSKDKLKGEDSQSVIIQGTDQVDGEIRIRMKPPVLTDMNETKKEKSREEVMAEREAKKMAKLNKKGKDSQSVAVKENIPNVVKPNVLSCNDVKPDAAEKSKAELRAERRAKQEAQRAAKEAQKKIPVQIPVSETKVTPKKSPEIKKDVKNGEKISKVASTGSELKSHQHKLFSHLYVEPQFQDLTTTVHPAIVELGKKYATRVVSGSNARCVSLLHALKQVITDYRVSATSDLNRGLEAELSSIGLYLSRSRPLSVSMTNSLRYLRSHLTQTSQLPEDEAKRKILEAIDTFIREQVDVAGQAISNTVQQKIANGDVILTYGCSSLVWRCLKESYQAGKEFSVVVVDGGPWYEGRELLRRLAALSIPCTYLLISAVGFAITKISKVLLGAHALLANGYVMSRTGSAMIALTASAHSVPVLVCCETYKFCERVQADAFVYNELGGSDELLAKGVKWLSPVYDITPPDLVTAVVTELAILPCTSVPVVLRVKPSDIFHTT